MQNNINTVNQTITDDDYYPLPHTPTKHEAPSRQYTTVSQHWLRLSDRGQTLTSRQVWHTNGQPRCAALSKQYHAEMDGIIRAKAVALHYYTQLLDVNIQV